MAWPTALEGDEIHVLQGCNMPVLLRRLDTLDGKSSPPGSLGDEKGKALAKKPDESPETEAGDTNDLDLRTKSSVFSASLDECCHNKDKVFQFIGLCYVHGLGDGEALHQGVDASTIFLR